jgi:hypothetical protein
VALLKRTVMMDGMVPPIEVDHLIRCGNVSEG